MIVIVYIALVIHLGYYLFLFSALALYRNHGESKKNKYSIVVCLKNESKYVDILVSSLKIQSAEKIILMDDFSTDNTFSKLKKYSSELIEILKATQDIPGKKWALNEALHQAPTNRILMTDADCIPASKNWGEIMSSYTTPIVLGYAPMNKSNNLIGVFSQYETYITALQYMSYTLRNIPYMGVGRNLLIEKALKSKSIIKGSHLPSGDDDLTINAISNPQNTSICIDPSTFVYSDPKTTLYSFIKQKKRHISTSFYYKPLHQFLLGLWSASQVIFYIFLIIGLSLGTITLQNAFIALCIKWSVQQTVHYPITTLLKEKDLLWKLPFLDVCLFLYYTIMPFILLTNKKELRWS